jgi:hypothetical protein
MKLSVSVPDSLWDQARDRRLDLNPSHLVQTALESWLDEGRAAAFSTERPKDLDEHFAAARARLASQARKQFEDGYRAALESTEKVSLETVSLLAEYRFDVRRWAENIARIGEEAAMGLIPRDHAWGGEELEALVSALGGLMSRLPGLDELGDPQPAFIRGFTQAMRDLWAETFEGEPTPSGQSETEEQPMSD